MMAQQQPIMFHQGRAGGSSTAAAPMPALYQGKMSSSTRGNNKPRQQQHQPTRATPALMARLGNRLVELEQRMRSLESENQTLVQRLGQLESEEQETETVADILDGW
jgi:hypothetical protein